MQVEKTPRETVKTRASGYGKRTYYFHADEDFREDHEWGKVKVAEQSLADNITTVTLSA